MQEKCAEEPGKLRFRMMVRRFVEALFDRTVSRLLNIAVLVGPLH